MRYADYGQRPDHPAHARRLTAEQLGMELAGELGVNAPSQALAGTQAGNFAGRARQNQNGVQNNAQNNG